MTRTLSNDFKSVVREKRNGQLIQERERKSREANFIIHGLREEISDKDLINMFLSETDVKFIPKDCKRLGKQIENKTRPLMVEMESLHKKNIVMMSLNKLKNIECDGKST